MTRKDAGHKNKNVKSLVMVIETNRSILSGKCQYVRKGTVPFYFQLIFRKFSTMIKSSQKSCDFQLDRIKYSTKTSCYFQPIFRKFSTIH